jgi:heme/copper-type cytochrome/quinol oxidase subunit 2
MEKMKKLMYVLAVAAMVLPGVVSAAGITPGALETSAQSSGLQNVGGAGSITGWANTIINWIIGLVGLLAILGFLISAILYFTAAGDEEKVTKAKNAMTYSIIGVVVALIGVIAINVISDFLAGGAI